MQKAVWLVHTIHEKTSAERQTNLELVTGTPIIFCAQEQTTSNGVRVLHIEPSFYPSTSSTPTVRADSSSYRDTQAPWSQNHNDTEILHCTR